MPLPDDCDKLARQRYAGGGRGGAPPIAPKLKGPWRPGEACHWMEQKRSACIKFGIVKVLSLLQMAAAVAYLQFRGRETIGIFNHTTVVLAYQIFFFVLEVISALSLFFRMFEIWRNCFRNCVDFKQIPNDLISPYFRHSRSSNVRPEHSNYPSIGVFIPCYNEDVDLVLETLLGAINIDYPKELLTIYLCDDGKDPLKRNLVSQLRKENRNLHYVIRPEHTHAKAGNLNYSLERTNTDLIVTLDADFVARPNLVQRLLPYYFVWNPDIEKYEFNETLCFVQTPQHFRNLSPYDSDPLDQRSTYFVHLVMPGKDWFNASTMIGTTNLLSRKPMKEAGYYPYHSITEDTAMSLRLHSLGYRSYFVNESLATGLATTSLWSNLGQRARWLKGDWQIFFSKHGPLTEKNLTFIQRILYFGMVFSRVLSVVHLLYDICAVLLLVGGIPPLDTPNALKFVVFISIYLGTSVVTRMAIVFGRAGLGKSESGSVAFEAIFRYTTVKGIFIALFMGKKLKFKVTQKSPVDKKKTKNKVVPSGDEAIAPEQFDENARSTILGQAAPDEPAIGMSGVIDAPSAPPSVAETSGSSGGQGDGDISSISISEEDNGRMFKKRRRNKSREERAVRRKDIMKNLKRIWFNILMAALLTFAIVYGIVIPPDYIGTVEVTIDGVRGVFKYKNLLPIAMALGFALINLLPHLLAIYLCFIPYVSGWMMSDLVHGRCDQYAVHPKTGKLFVPWSFISLLTIAKIFLMGAALAALAYFTFSNNKPEFVPLPDS